MKILYFIFDLPRLTLELILPFSGKRYHPATEWERTVSENVKNRVRLANYYANRLTSPRK